MESKKHHDNTDELHSSSIRRPPQGRPEAATTTGRDSSLYRMDHAKRGLCLIFCHREYADPEMDPRTSAWDDAAACQSAFADHGFDVRLHYDRTTEEYHKILYDASQADHRDHDCLSVVFMSHGNSSGGKQTFRTYDGDVDAASLWKPFRAEKCTQLAGKPKLFFIQACRGEERDCGVAMRVMTDAAPPENHGDYVIPLEADFLIMWAAAPGKVAFRTERENIHGCVFIHFLTKNLLDCVKSNQEMFLDLVLLQVTRQVAIEFESNITRDELKRLHRNKQVPQTVSTLLRRVPLTTAKATDDLLETML